MAVITFQYFTDIAIIGGNQLYGNSRRGPHFTGGLIGNENLDDVEVISLVNDSILYPNKTIPSLPKGLSALGGTRLPNGDLFLSGGQMNGKTHEWSDPLRLSNEYLLYRERDKQWTKVGTMLTTRYHPASVAIDDCVITIGGGVKGDSDEKFSCKGCVKSIKAYPAHHNGHTATMFGQHKILVCGGRYNRVNIKNFLITEVDDNLKSLLVEKVEYYIHCFILF